ncbi:MAG: HD domain-containing protein [Evtepia gabavorous]
MEPRTLLNALAVAERLKGTTRHCYTSNGRRESVAEHSWMMTLMAFFLQEEFPEADMNRSSACALTMTWGGLYGDTLKEPGGRGSRRRC